MAVVTKSASSNTVVTTGWTNPTNAYASDNVYATASPGRSATVNSDYGFAFALADFAGAAAASNVAIDQIVLTCEWKLSATGVTGATLGGQLYDNGVAQGTEVTDTTSTTDTNKTQTITSGVTASDLIGGLLKARVRASKGATNTAVTMSLDYVKVDVTYHLVDPVAPTAVSATSSVTASVGKIAAAVSPQGNAFYAVPRQVPDDTMLTSRVLGPLTSAAAGGPKAVVPSTISASSSVTASVTRLAAVTPAAVTATSAVTASVLDVRRAQGNAIYAVPQPVAKSKVLPSRVIGPGTPPASGTTKSVSPAAITASSGVTASVVALRRVAPASVAATSSVTAAVVKVGGIRPAAVASTSNVTAAVVALKAIRPTATATSPVTASVVMVRALRPSATATSTVTASVAGATAHGTTYYAVPRNERPEVQPGSRLLGPLVDVSAASIAPNTEINATSTVTASVGALRRVVPAATATSPVTATLARIFEIAASLTATSTITAAVRGPFMSAVACGSGTMSAVACGTGTMTGAADASSSMTAVADGASTLSPATTSTGSMSPT